MPFVLTNADDTFQRAMDYAFKDLIGKLIEIYQDDLTVISKKRTQHIQHLRVIFQRCREYGIPLNPKKSIFGVDRTKLSGHIISKDKISMDPSRIESRKKIHLSEENKSLQSFFGENNFIRRFIPNFFKIVKPLNRLLKKDDRFKWDNDGKKDFQHIKEAINITHVIISTDIIIFSFASEDTITWIILQKNDQGDEQLIAFMRKTLRDSELNYTIT